MKRLTNTDFEKTFIQVIVYNYETLRSLVMSQR